MTKAEDDFVKRMDFNQMMEFAQWVVDQEKKIVN